MQTKVRARRVKNQANFDQLSVILAWSKLQQNSRRSEMWAELRGTAIRSQPVGEAEQAL